MLEGKDDVGVVARDGVGTVSLVDQRIAVGAAAARKPEDEHCGAERALQLRLQMLERAARLGQLR